MNELSSTSAWINAIDESVPATASTSSRNESAVAGAAIAIEKRSVLRAES